MGRVAGCFVGAIDVLERGEGERDAGVEEAEMTEAGRLPRATNSNVV